MEALNKRSILCVYKDNEENELNTLEKYYIELYQCFNNEFGLNLKEGGNCAKLSIETRKKISLSLTGRPSASKGIKRKKMSIETREKMSKIARGRVFSEKWKINISKSLKGKPKSERAKQKMSNSSKLHSPNRNKLIINIENGIFYINKKEAANSLNLNVWTLKQKLLGYIKNKTSFRYA